MLDEPPSASIRDGRRLVEILHRLRANQNTVVVVEHDPGDHQRERLHHRPRPQSREQGGQLMFAGPYNDLLKSEESLTAAYLSQRKMIPFPARNRKQLLKGSIRITALRRTTKEYRRRDSPVFFVCITGVSGSEIEPRR